MRAELLLIVAGCGFSADLGEPIPGETVTITDDTFDGPVVDGIATPGTVEPDGFFLGGLFARAYQTGLVDPGENFDKVLADAAALTPAGMGYAQVPTDWLASRPRGLGLTIDGGFSVIWEGEILLPKGAVTLEGDVDDRALVQVALDRKTFGSTLVGDVAGGNDSVTFTVPEAGWYPIRAALTEDTGSARLALTIVQGQVRTPVDGARLRSRVTNARGLVVYAFDLQGFVSPRGHALRPTIAEQYFGGAPPYDLTASFDRFSLRFAGQIKIDTAGTYDFAATVGSDDGYRIWIDGKLIAHHWLGHPDQLVGSVALTPGWHSIVVDYADEIGGAEIAVTMNGAPLDPMKLRPVVVHGNTFTVATVGTPVMIKDLDSTFLPLPLEGDAFTLIDSVDYGFDIDNQEMSQLAITMFDCNNNGKPLTVNPTPSYHYFPADLACAGNTTNPPIDWSIRITDSVAGNGLNVGAGTVRDFGVTALYRGGPKMPFAPVVIYTSPPRATPRAVRIDAVRALGTLDGATVEVAVRTADDEASLSAAQFEVLGDGESFVASEVAQYRITISTNGWIAPVLDAVEIVYLASP